jgi:putative methyltransferase (TIGR04325 family)
MPRLAVPPVERVRNYLRSLRLLAADTRDQVHHTRDVLLARLDQLEAAVREQSTADRTERLAEHRQTVEILRFLHDGAYDRRRRLRELRDSDEYEEAFRAVDPLVSIVIPTYDSPDLIRERSIPSALAQTYGNIEIVVVGDAASDDVVAAVASFDDPRIRFENRLYRGPYPEDPLERWLVAGVPPYNEAVRASRGVWLAPLDDDDYMRPDHIERLLRHAREYRLEMAYGRLCMHTGGGGTKTLGTFPPEHIQFGLQATVYMRRLADIFELELADSAFRLPYDWALCVRMLEAGVRIGMLDEVVTDYYPSRLLRPRFEEPAAEPPSVPESQAPAPSEDGDGASDPEWEYVAEGFAGASRGTRAAMGWDAEDVARAYRDKWPAFLDAVSGTGPLGVNHEVLTGAPIDRHDVTAQNTHLALGYAVARTPRSGSRLSVLDWGGALGHHFVVIKQLYPELDLDYHCREMPAVCAAGRATVPEVTFHDDDGCLDREYDLVLASSALQYAEDWRALVGRFARSARGRVFITRLPWATDGHDSFIVLQRADAYGYATEYLGWVFNRRELLDVAEEARLRLEREFILHEDIRIPDAPDGMTHSAFLFTPEGRP